MHKRIWSAISFEIDIPFHKEILGQITNSVVLLLKRNAYDIGTLSTSEIGGKLAMVDIAPLHTPFSDW